MICTWSNEQATREIYIKLFEMAVKEGGASAVMTAYNYIGITWAGAKAELLVNILRNEWGFHGVSLILCYNTWTEISDFVMSCSFSNIEKLLCTTSSFFC